MVNLHRTTIPRILWGRVSHPTNPEAGARILEALMEFQNREAHQQDSKSTAILGPRLPGPYGAFL